MARRTAAGRVVAILAATVTACAAIGLVPGLTPAAGAGSDGTVSAFGSAGHHGSTAAMGLRAPLVGLARTPPGAGYWLASSDGGVFAFGDAAFRGSLGNLALNAPIVAIAATPTGNGYWLAAADGGIFSFGDAPFRGSLGGWPLNAPIVAIAATPSGNGYWLAAADGGIFSFGDAPFRGSLGGWPLNAPIVAIAATPSGNGYWLAAADGGVFTFGDARYRGSTGALRLAAPIVGIATTPTGNGYWLAAADGGVFSFGDAGYHGSAAGQGLTQPVTSLAATSTGDGYWLLPADGGVRSYGDAVYFGGGLPADRHAVAMAGAPDDGGYWLLADASLYAPLGPGATGAAVAVLQRELQNRGFWVGTTDGVYSPTVTFAVIAVQKAHGLPRTGFFDAATRDALLRGAPAPRFAGDHAEVDLGRQILMIVRGGRTQWVFHISTGKASTPTRPGSFRIFRNDPGRTASCAGCLYRPKYFDGGRAFHGYIEIPTYPASHGCVRLPNPSMDFIWAADLIPFGSPVLIA